MKPTTPSGVAYSKLSAMTWHGLSHPELRCLELAWEAHAHGSVPVGAVLCDADGSIVSEGRSRMYEVVAPRGQLANSLLAHAEINALVRLDPERRYENHTLYSSLEPCPLCLGAVGMATVGALVYLGEDPYGGAVGLHQPTPHQARVPLRVRGPRADAVGLLAAALHVAFYLRRNPAGKVVQVHRELTPDVVAAARNIRHAGGDRWAHDGQPLLSVFDRLLAEVQ